MWTAYRLRRDSVKGKNQPNSDFVSPQWYLDLISILSLSHRDQAYAFYEMFLFIFKPIRVKCSVRCLEVHCVTNFTITKSITSSAFFSRDNGDSWQQNQHGRNNFTSFSIFCFLFASLFSRHSQIDLPVSF